MLDDSPDVASIYFLQYKTLSACSDLIIRVAKLEQVDSTVSRVSFCHYISRRGQTWDILNILEISMSDYFLRAITWTIGTHKSTTCKYVQFKVTVVLWNIHLFITKTGRWSDRRGKERYKFPSQFIHLRATTIFFIYLYLSPNTTGFEFFDNFEFVILSIHSSLSYYIKVWNDTRVSFQQTVISIHRFNIANMYIDII